MSQQTNQAELEQLQMRFIVGSDAPLTIDQCPKNWQGALEKTPAELLPIATLALLGHYQNSQEMPAPSESLTASPTFPKLSLPEVPKRWHSVIAEIINDDSDQYFFMPMLQFLARRGYVIPPHFWQKETSSLKRMGDYPKVYHPWRAWFNQKETLDFAFSNEAISVENWDDFYPAARREALRELRKTNPKAAREIIAACLAREKSEQRTEIMDVFNENLSPEDAPFLHSLKEDRSGKVRDAVNILLAQIEEPNEEMIAEQVAAIKSHFTFKEVGEKGQQHWSLRSKKVHNQDSVALLLEMARLKRFAEAFNVSEGAIITAWDWQHNTWLHNTIFVKKMAQSYPVNEHSEAEKSDVKSSIMNHINIIVEKIITRDSYANIEHVVMLWQKLTTAEQHAVFLSSFKDTSVHTKLLRNLHLAIYLLLITPPLEEGQISFEALKQTRLWRIIYFAEKGAKKNQYNWHFTTLCTALGFFLPRDLALEFNRYIAKQFGNYSMGMLFLNTNLT